MATAKKEVSEVPPVERVIALIAGESGSGKSFLVANFHNALIFDTDIGGGLAYLDARIRRNGSERVPVSSYREVLAELRQRFSRGRLKDVNTVVIDHLTTLQQEAVDRCVAEGEGGFGRESAAAAREWRAVREYVRKIDANLICTAHLKGKWENQGGKVEQVGTVADAAKNLEGDMMQVIHLRAVDGPPTRAKPSRAWVQKWRRDPDDPRGLVPAHFPATIETLTAPALFGEGLAAPRVPVEPCSPEQAAELKGLIEVVKVSDEDVQKWLKKAKVDTLDELPPDVAAKCIEFVRGKLPKPAEVANG